MELASTIITALLSSGSVSLIMFFVTRHDQKKAEKKANSSAQARMLLGLGHDELTHVCDKYLKRGYITTAEYDDLNKYLYEPYTALGGNGSVERAMQQIKELPARPTEEGTEHE